MVTRDAIIVFNGCFCPVHAGHMRALLETKRKVEAAGKVHVVAGYFAVAPDSYVKRKLPAGDRLEPWMEAASRVELCRAVAEDVEDKTWIISAAENQSWQRCGKEMVAKYHSASTEVIGVRKEAKQGGVCKKGCGETADVSSTFIRSELSRNGYTPESVDELVQSGILGRAVAELLKAKMHSVPPDEAAPPPMALAASRSFDVSNESSCTREIRAIHDEGSVVVYQAYSDDIADMAAKANSFRAPLDAGLWKSSRMTWIKPSAVWMAYRCGWTTMKDKGQSRVLALHLRREAFEALLMQAQLSHGPAETRASEPPPVVVQWDPEREMDTAAVGKQVFTRPLRARSIQIGLRGPAVEKLLDPGFLVKIEDVTQRFRAAAACLEAGDVAAAAGKFWPRDQERPMSVPSELRAVLAMGGADER